MALPKEPRQKMINMMYLVLTALLAINVSAEILNAFKTVDHGINRSNDLFKTRLDEQFKAFDREAKDQGESKVAPYRDKALQAKAFAENACQYIDALKLEVRKAAGGKEPDGDGFAMDNMEGPTRLMDNMKRGVALRDSLIKLRQDMLTLVPASQLEAFKQTLALKIDTPEVENKGNRDWVGAHFRMVPAIANITILDKFENDIRASANAIIDDNLSQINAQDIKFDKYMALVSQSSGYVMNGQTVTAKIGVGAYSSGIKPEITVDGDLMNVTDGLASFSESASGAGLHDHKVRIKVPSPGGGVTELDGDIVYNVGSSTFAVSSDLTKVVFRGIDNPISVSGGGVGAEALSVTASSGSITKTGAGKYILKPGESNEDKITVIAHRPDGSTVNLGSEAFQVKDLPNPVAYVGLVGGGRMRSAEFRVNTGLRAVLENFDFLSGVRFEVTGFTLYAVGGDQLPSMVQGTSNSFSFEPIKNIISKCKPGTIVSFEDIHAKGPDGRTRKLRGISFQLY